MLKSWKDRLFLAALVIAAAVGVVGWLQWFDDDQTVPADGDTARAIAALSGDAAKGAALFEENCMTCHGPNATGSDQGPPLVHRIYEPNHHGDMSFQLAVKNGVRAHHWKFGNMAPVDGVSPEDVEKIIVYVRALQQANGIF